LLCLPFSLSFSVFLSFSLSLSSFLSLFLCLPFFLSFSVFLSILPSLSLSFSLSRPQLDKESSDELFYNLKLHKSLSLKEGKIKVVALTRNKIRGPML
jgi:hypothetical protein